VRVTANGTMIAAGQSGGYGKVVDVDYGNGFVTRYGHLSEIDVKVGQTLRVGQAVDPEKFLRAGAKLDGGF
jgi:murein DD-endopeptidase MepM/ murein hydrolase activator NlpD